MTIPDIAEQASEFLLRIRTPGLPALGPQVREGVAPPEVLLDRLEDFPAGSNPVGETCRLLQAAALLWHDHLEASHRISQGVGSAEGFFLHGIMHRREPDNSNAKYWFRKVGQHPCYPRLVDALQGELEEPLQQKLFPGGEWDPMAFVDACTGADPGQVQQYGILQRIQEAEFSLLVDHILATHRIRQ